MKRCLVIFLCLLPFSGPSFAEMCTDFDDNQNLIEYECGTSLEDVLESKAKSDAARRAAEESAKKEAELLEQKRIAEENAKKEAERVKQEKKKAEEKAEQERIRAEEQAKREAEKAERERIRAEERANRKAERERIRAEERANRKAEREKRRENWYNFWKTHNIFISIAHESSSIYVDDANPNAPTRGLNLQLGFVWQPKDSGWEFGARLDTSEINSSLNDINLHVTGREYYAAAFAGYNIWADLDLYGGLGLGHVNIKKEYQEDPKHTDNQGLFSTKAFIGAEYDILKYLGVFAELSARITSESSDFGFVVGGKIIF